MIANEKAQKKCYRDGAEKNSLDDDPDFRFHYHSRMAGAPRHAEPYIMLC